MREKNKAKKLLLWKRCSKNFRRPISCLGKLQAFWSNLIQRDALQNPPLPEAVQRWADLLVESLLQWDFSLHSFPFSIKGRLHDKTPAGRLQNENYLCVFFYNSEFQPCLLCKWALCDHLFLLVLWNAGWVLRTCARKGWYFWSSLKQTQHAHQTFPLNSCWMDTCWLQSRLSADSREASSLLSQL